MHKARSRSAATDVARGGQTERNLRLSIATINFYPIYSGAGVRFKRYIPGFVERGVDVVVCSGTPDRIRIHPLNGRDEWRRLRNGAFLPTETVDGVSVQRVRLPEKPGVRRDAWFVWRVADLCSESSSRPDILQMFSIPPATVPALWRIRRMGVPVVATQTIMPVFPAHPLKQALLRASFDVSSRLVSCVVASSEVMAGGLRQQGIRTRIEVIPHGVDISRFRPPSGEDERVEARESLSIPHDHPVLLFVGSIAPRKGVDLLLQAWSTIARKHPSLHLVMIGPRPDLHSSHGLQYLRQLDTLIHRSSTRNRIHLVGRVEDVPAYMRCADLFVFPSRREGMPNAVLEAMASGVPVVTTPFAGFPSEFGEPGRNFIRTTFDPAEIAADVSALLEAPQRRAELAASARRWVEDYLDIRRSLDRYVELYSELASGGA